MTINTTVKFFNNSQSGAPALSGVAGSLITLLDACLVNGYGSITLDSLVISGNVATGTISAGHGFTMVGDAGPVIAISGATPAGLNGEWRIASVPNAQTFTFITSGISNQTATGTIAAKRAPAGFEKVFSGTNKAVYRALAGNRLYLRVDDSNATYARTVAYESMSDVDTGTNPFPTGAQLSGGHYYVKSSDSGARNWRLFSDDRLFYVLSRIYATGWDHYGYGTATLAFGDFFSYADIDPYGVLIVGQLDSTTTGSYSSLGWMPEINAAFLTTQRFKVARLLSGTLSGELNPFHVCWISTNNVLSRGCRSIEGIPNATQAGFTLLPVYLRDSQGLRGHLPGLTVPLADLTDSLTQTDTEGNVWFIANFSAIPNTSKLESTLVAVNLMGAWR